MVRHRVQVAPHSHFAGDLEVLAVVIQFVEDVRLVVVVYNGIRHRERERGKMKTEGDGEDEMRLIE